MKNSIILFICIIAVHVVVGQGVGIGTTTPHAPLHFNNLPLGRKIVLWEGDNNEHQYIGLGVNLGILRYQVSTGTDNHIFYAGANSSISNELMRIQGNGNVGINVSNPLNKLEIHSGPAREGSHATARSLYITGDFFESSNGVEFRHYNGTQGIGFGHNTLYAAGSNTDQNLGIKAKGTTGNVILTTNDAERMRVTGGGNVGVGTANPLQKLHVGGKLAVDNNVGIGNTDPHAPLQFSNDLPNRKIVLFEAANNDHQFYGFGVNSNTLRYQVSNITGKHVFYSGASETSSNELMLITGEGRVGIGITNPTAMLEIARGTAPNGSLWVNGTTYASHFNFGPSEDTYIRGGKSGGKVIINDYGDFGNVGIGTASPLQKLHVGGNVAVDGNVGIGVTSPVATLEIERGTAPFGTLQINGTNHDSHFNYGGPETTYIRGGKPGANVIINELGGLGNVGIGTASPAQKLHVGGNLAVEGNVGIGIASPTEKLDVNGNVDISGTLKIGYERILGPIVNVNGLTYNSTSCNCPSGLVALGGGFHVSNQLVRITRSWANSDSSWFIEVYNADVGTQQFQAFVICARMAN